MAKKNKNGNEKALKKTENIPLDIPGMVDGIQPGLECVDEADIILPRLALVQSMSKCVDAEDDSAPKPGMFLNTLTMDAFDAPVEVVPIFYNKAAIKFAEKVNDPIECQSRDSVTGNSGLCGECESNWNDWSNGTPGCTSIHEFICLFKSEDPSFALPFIISMMRSSAKIGKQWISIAKVSRAPLFAASYLIGKEQKENDYGKFFVFTIRPSGRIDPNPYKSHYLSLFEAYRGNRIKVDYENPADRITDDESFDTDKM